MKTELSTIIGRYTKANREVNRLQTLALEAELAEDWPTAIDLQQDLTLAMLERNLTQMRMYQLADSATIDQLIKTMNYGNTAEVENRPAQHRQADAPNGKGRIGRTHQCAAPDEKGGYHHHDSGRAHGIPAHIPDGTLPKAVHHYAPGAQTWN